MLCQTTAKTAPDDAALLRRCIALQRAGRPEEAEAGYRRLLDRRPRDARVSGLLGLLLVQNGRNREAAALMDEAIAAGGRDAGLFNSHALAMTALARYPEAVDSARRAAALKPDRAELQINLGNALRRADRAEEALQAYRRAIALNPQHASARIGLGNAQAALGDSDAAAAAYRAALARQPDSVRAFYHLALTAKVSADAADTVTVERFRRRTEDAALPDGDAVLLHNALGFLADRRGDHETAFAHFAAFNRAAARRHAAQGRRFDPAAHEAFVDALIAAFPGTAFPGTAATDAAPQPGGGERAVFIVGMPRSGTTLVEQIVASHSQVAGGGELPHLPALVSQIPDYPAGTARLPPGRLHALAADYLKKLDAVDPEARHVTDKLPLNLLHLGLIARLLPAATVIHCRRDPRDSGLSCYFHNFANGHDFTCELAHIGAFYRGVERLMAHWRRTTPLRLIEVGYEDLVEAPEPAVRAVIAALGLPWEDGCLRYRETRRSVGSASQLQVRQAIGRGAVGRWRRYRAHLQPLLAALEGTARKG